jgi:hypothetical protein
VGDDVRCGRVGIGVIVDDSEEVVVSWWMGEALLWAPMDEGHENSYSTEELRLIVREYW